MSRLELLAEVGADVVARVLQADDPLAERPVDGPAVIGRTDDTEAAAAGSAQNNHLHKERRFRVDGGRKAEVS